MSGRHRASRRARRLQARRRARIRRLTASSSAALFAVASLTATDKLPPLDRVDDDGPATDEFAALPPSPDLAPIGTATARAKHAAAARAGDRATPHPSVEVTLSPGPDEKPPPLHPLPADSGAGKRVVYDLTGQQVWLVDADGAVVRTYMVSGSRYDQLEPGRYEVYSASRDAISWTGDATMEYMVRFYRSVNSNIGFHDIPVSVDTGEEVQTLSQLGTPLSDGCVRQDHADAKALYEFAPVGTPVFVVST